MIRRRDNVEHACRHVGLFRDDTTESRCIPRCVRCRLENRGVSGGKHLGNLVDRDFKRVVPRHNRSDNTHCFFPHESLGFTHCGFVHTHIAVPLKLVDHADRIEDAVFKRPVKLSHICDGSRATNFVDQFLAQFFLFFHERIVHLAQDTLSEFLVGGPIGLVERSTCCIDSTVHVFLGAVRNDTEDLLGRWVDVVEGIPIR